MGSHVPAKSRQVAEGNYLILILRVFRAKGLTLRSSGN